MSDCYLCGGDNSHTFDCPKLSYVPTSPPSITPPTSSIVTFKIQNTIWRIDIVKIGEMIPIWATHAWYISAVNAATLEQSAVEWENICRNLVEPPQTLNYKGLKAGEKYSSDIWNLLVFGFLQDE